MFIVRASSPCSAAWLVLHVVWEVCAERGCGERDLGCGCFWCGLEVETGVGEGAVW